MNFAPDKLQDPAKAPEMASKRENSCVYKDFIGQKKKISNPLKQLTAFEFNSDSFIDQ